MESTSGTARTPESEFIEASRVFLRDDFLPKLLYCVEKLSDEDLWWRPNEVSNSIGNLVLHLCGNVRQWIVASIGGAQFKRNRDGEFAARGPIPKTELMGSLKQVLAEVDAALAQLEAGQLMGRLKIQTYDVSTLQAVYHVVEHFSYHLGQILYIYKMRTGTDPQFYKF
ncbi:MAG TPA: DinB family protein [Terriglobia bacterium]|nr:DinB family protein [Terriglobia bacterium]